MPNSSKKRYSKGDDSDGGAKRPAPQRLLYQPHEFVIAFKLLVKNRPPHPSGKAFLDILEKNLRGRESSGLQTFVSSKMRNELRSGKYDKALSTLSKTERLYIEGDYMKGDPEFKMPASAISNDEESIEDTSLEDAETESEKKEEGDKPDRPKLLIQKFKFPSRQTSTVKSPGTEFSPLRVSTPVHSKAGPSLSCNHQISIQDEVQRILNVKVEELKQIMVEVCEEYWSKLRREECKTGVSSSAEGCTENQSSLKDASNTKNKVSEESITTAASPAIGSGMTGQRPKPEENARPSVELSVSDVALANITEEVDKIITKQHGRVQVPCEDNDSSTEDDTLDARVSTITLVEIYMKRSRKNGVNFNATAGKKSFKLSPKNIANWSTTGAAGTATQDDNLQNQLLSAIPQLDVVSAMEESNVVLGELKVTEGKPLFTKLGFLKITEEKKIPMLLTVIDKE